MDKLMQEGGMTDDGLTQEPVTGNDIPPGALASEVRDDVDTKLSGGEYVVPADVLRYYGVRFFEDLRSQAKQGMMDMESEGRIGGAPVDSRGVPMQGQDEELTPEEEQMLMQAMADSEGMSTSGMAEGGMAFNRADFTMPASGSGPIDSRLYFNPNTGEKRTINFMSGTALGAIPEGFVPWTQALQDTYDATKAATPAPKLNNSNSRNDNSNNQPEPANYDVWLDENYDAITKDPYQFGMNSLKTPDDSAGLAGGLIGIVTGKDKDIQNVANANASLKLMEAKGETNTPQYKSLAEEVKKYVSNLSPIEKGLIFTKVAATGNALVNSVQDRQKEKTPEAVSAPAANPPAPKPAPVSPSNTSGNTSSGSSSSSSGTTDEQQKAAYTAPRPQTLGVTPPAPTPTRTVNTPSGPQEVRVQAGSERFAEGGLVTKPKKTRAKTKGLAGKQ